VRISLIAPCWYAVPPAGYGGIELVVALLADGLVARGHDVTLYAAEGSTTDARLVAPSPPPAPSALGDPWCEVTHALAAYLDDHPVDLVHDHSGIVGPALGAVRAHAPVIHTLHGPWTDEARALYRRLHRRIGLVAISEAQRCANPEVTYAGVVHNGIDLDAYPLVTAKGEHLVFVGRANPEKNPAGAIEVARRAGRPLTMIVKCEEPEEQAYWDEYVVPLLGSDVDVRTRVSHAEKAELVATAYAMVFPIRWDEPFGLVITEAMACGTPVITAPRGAAVELVDHGTTGFLCTSVDAMVGAVREAGSLSPTECRRWVATHFSADAMVDGYERVYQAAASRVGAVAAR
jgi:glycosyltransferase involved in cell wall biosynthesis